jgi:uncharacterized membrane protein
MESRQSFESNKILGGVGALLAGIGSLVLFSGSVGIVGIVGVVLLLISLRGLAEDFEEPAIFRNAITGFVFGVIGILFAVAVFQAFAFLSGFIFVHPVMGAVGLVGAIIAWIVMFVFLLLAGLFFKHVFDVLANRSGEGLLNTGALILLLGSVLTIVFVGFFLLFVSWIIIAVGLFQLRPPMQPTQAYSPPPKPSTSDSASTVTVKYCPHCGAENKPDGTFCTHCGRRMNPT